MRNTMWSRAPKRTIVATIEKMSTRRSGTALAEGEEPREEEHPADPQSDAEPRD